MDADEAQEFFSLDARLGRLRAQYDAGDGEALLDVLHECALAGEVVPEWARQAFTLAWAIRWKRGDCRSLGESFGIERPKGWTQKRHRKDWHDTLLWQEVVRIRREQDITTSRDLFEEAAASASAKYGIAFNGTDVQEAYYRVNPGRDE